MFADPADVHVIKTDIKGELRRDVSRTSAEETLSWKNATPDYSYSCFDYYSNYRSTVAYNWLVATVCPSVAITRLTIGAPLSKDSLLMTTTSPWSG